MLLRLLRPYIAVQKLLSDRVSFHSVLENVNTAKDSIRLRNSLPHKVSKLSLENLGGVSCLEELGYFSSQVFVDIKGFHSSVDCVQFPLELSILLVELIHV